MNLTHYLKHLLLGCCLLAFSNVSFAMEKPQLILDQAGKSFKLCVNNSNEHSLSVKIIDQEGNTIFSEKLDAHPKFTKQYDLSILPTGQYELEVNLPTRILMHRLLIESKEILLVEKSTNVIFKPMMTLDDRLLKINLFAQQQAVTINIYDNNGEKIHNSNFAPLLKLHQLFDLADLPAGEYILSIAIGKRTFYGDLELTGQPF